MQKDTSKGDDILSAANIGSKRREGKTREKKFQSDHIFWFVSSWYGNSSGITEEEKTQDVLDKLPEYYAFMFSGVRTSPLLILVLVKTIINTFKYLIHTPTVGYLERKI